MEFHKVTEYKIDSPHDRRALILSSRYTTVVKEFMLQMISADYAYDCERQLVQAAKNMADVLIEETDRPTR